MLARFSRFSLLIFCLNMIGQNPTAAQQGFHQFRVKNIFGDSVNLSDYAGKKLLVVNTASFCGYTYQFTKLRQLDSAYQPFGFRVIGFPCNDFGGQDPYADSTIFTFCLNQYSIQFPMMAKISIIAGDTSPVYKWLQRKALNGVGNASVDWNFNKFLIDENGNWVRHFSSPTEPNDTAITHWITQTVTAVSPLKDTEMRCFFDSENQLHLRIPFGQKPQKISLYSLQGILLQEKGLVKNADEYISRLDCPLKGTFLLVISDQSGGIILKRLHHSY